MLRREEDTKQVNCIRKREREREGPEQLKVDKRLDDIIVQEKQSLYK